MTPVEYVFRIDAFTPETLPMARLGEYLTALARLLGHPEHTHFIRLDAGSARLVHKVDPVDAPKVESRLNSVRVGAASKDAMFAHQLIEDLLANDNAIGELSEVLTGRVVIPFVGRNKQKTISFPPFRENAAIDGQVVSIGGRDATAHATLQDGDIFHSNVVMKRELARELGKLLYGPSVRLHGSGRYERQNDGGWKLLDFKVDRIELLDDRSIGRTLSELREVPNNGLMQENAYLEVGEMRYLEGER